MIHYSLVESLRLMTSLLLAPVTQFYLSTFGPVPKNNAPIAATRGIVQNVLEPNLGMGSYGSWVLVGDGRDDAIKILRQTLFHFLVETRKNSLASVVLRNADLSHDDVFPFTDRLALVLGLVDDSIQVF